MHIPSPLLIQFCFILFFEFCLFLNAPFNGLSIRNAVLLLQLCAVLLQLAALGKQRTSSRIKDMLEEDFYLVQAFLQEPDVTERRLEVPGTPH